MNKNIQYPDFSIRFLGTKHVTPEVYPRGWLVWEFEVQPNDTTDKLIVTWSEGTGVIAPTYFEVAGKEYVLEMVYTEAIEDSLNSHLEDDEMIIWKEKTFLRKVKSR